MPRPKRCRRVRGNPSSLYFKPAGIPKSSLEEVNLEDDEFEAIRLCDFLEMQQTEASEKMKISQPTLGRILKSGRKKISDAIVNGKSIKLSQ